MRLGLCRLVVVGALVAPMTMALAGAPAHAAVGSVTISELHYNPSTGESEFLELANTSGAVVDLGGWRISSGVDYTFPLGTLLQPTDRLALTRNAASFQSVYGTAAFGQYAGALSNGGETVELVDASGASIDAVTYSDSGAWPVAADGGGPSLELIDLQSDNSLPASWLVSRNEGGTPAAVNTAETPPPASPVITAVDPVPMRPAPAQAVVIEATITGAESASVIYRVGFGAEVTVALLDDLASPGGAGDGRYSAVIPGQVAGSLVRYRISATNAVGSSSIPLPSDSIDYHGVVVTDPARSTALPTIEWWMEDHVYNDLRKNHRFDDVFGAAVIAYDGVVYDNAQMRVRGGDSRTLAHNSWNVELPAGHPFDMPGRLTTPPVDEFNLQWDGIPTPAVAWDLVRNAGFPGIDYFPIASYRNGKFWGGGSYSTNIDGAWRRNNGYDTGNMYKGDGYPALEASATPAQLVTALELKEGNDDDRSVVAAFARGFGTGTPAQRREYILDRVDVPKMINYLAVVGYLKHWDSANHNWYLVNDSADTDRWYMIPWDLDLTLRRKANDPASVGDFLQPNTSPLPQAMLAQPEFRQMYFRRLKSLIDAYPLATYPVSVFNPLYQQAAPDLLTSWKFWRQWGKPSDRAALFAAGAKERGALFAANTGRNRSIPPTQTAARPIVLSSVRADAASQAGQFVELTNSSRTESFDLSGWTIEELGLTLQPGTVILPQQKLVLVRNDRQYRDVNAPTLIGGEFDVDLMAGATITLRDAAGAVVAVGTAA